jgi:hypothetical protein
VSGDGHGALLITTPTRILRLQRDNSYLVVAGTDDQCGGFGGPPCGAEGDPTSTAIHPGQVEADPSSDAIYFVEGLTVRRVLDHEIDTVFNTSATTCRADEPCGDGGPALDARPSTTPTIAVAPDGRLHILDQRRVRRIEDDGTISTVATVPEEGVTGAFDISPTGAMAVGGTSGIWRRTTGAFARATLGDCTQPPDPCGDGGPAARAPVHAERLDFDADGRLYVQDRHRVRVIDTDGTVRHVAGSWQTTASACNENECARFGTAATVPLEPFDIGVDGDDLVLTTAYVGRLLRVTAPMRVPPAPPQGYRMVASDGGVFTFGWSTFHGSTGDLQLVSPIVAGASNGRGGYWFVAGDGGVFTFGNAGFFGSAAGATSSPVVDMARTPTGNGYWLLERNGRVHAFGDAPHRGDGVPTATNVAIVGARSGNGYRIVRSDGAQDDRQDQIGGQPASFPALHAPIIHARPTPSGKGLWLVAGDGGVFTQGDAGFFGSTGAMRLNQPVVDLVPTPTGRGYWLVARDGGVFTFGDAAYVGSMGAVRLNRPVVAGVAGPQVSG